MPAGWMAKPAEAVAVAAAGISMNPCVTVIPV